GKKQEKLLDGFLDGAFTKEQVNKKSEALGERQAVLQRDVGAIDATLLNMPSAEQVKLTAEEIAGNFRYHTDKKGRTHSYAHIPRHQLVANISSYHFEQMTWEEQRELVEMVFGGRTPGGKRMGAYIEWIEGQERRRVKEWRFML